MSTLEKPLSEVVRGRRATPSFSDEPVADDDLRRILEAGQQAPSGYNLQPWRFVVVRDPEQRKRLRAAAMNQSKVEEAPVVVVACGDPEAWREGDLDEMLRISAEHGYGDSSSGERVKQTVNKAFASGPGDAGGWAPSFAVWVNRHVMIAFTHIMLMAEALGYDTAPMEGFYESKVREALGIPDRVRVVALLALGRRKGEDKPYGGRFALDKICFAERWGEKLGL